MKAGAGTVRFGRRLVRLFAAASGDDHPLHTSRELSRLTPYGEPIVYGILQGLAALAAVRQEPGWVLRGVSFDFLGSAVPGVDYGLEVERLAEDRVRVRIQDGRLPVLVANVAFGRPGEMVRGGAATGGAGAPEGTAWRVEDRYRPDPEALAAVMAATGLDQPWIAPGHVAALMWASFLVGVEHRHDRVLLVGVKALFGEPPEGGDFACEAWIERTGGRGEIVFSGRFGGEGSSFCALRVAAARLASPPEPSAGRLRDLLGEASPGSAGKTALVIGGSRGLGAALAQGLALAGYRVLATHSRGTGPVTPVELLQVDARSHRGYEQLARRILDGSEGLDVLVINAWPAIRPLSIAAGSARRARRHLADGLAIVTEALMSLVPALRPGGWNVLISSAYVGSPRPYFAHYIAGKAAAEALVRSAAVEHPSLRHLIVRPPKLKTHQTSSALGGSALDVEPVAAAVVERLRGDQPPGVVEVLEEIPAVPVHGKP